jgi:TPR repeat protein
MLLCLFVDMDPAADAANEQFTRGQATSDEEEAASCFHMASIQGHTGAQYELGNCYWFGVGVEQDNEKAVSLYHLAARKAHAGAQCSLGEYYLHAPGAERNQEKGFKFYRMASAQGHAEATFELAQCYLFALGVRGNEMEAIKLFRMLSNQGHAGAQSALGRCYRLGWGVEENQEEAVRFYRLASAQGHSLAWYELGNCYRWGWGVEENVEEAARFYHMASDRGHADACDALKELDDEIVDEAAEAASLASPVPASLATPQVSVSVPASPAAEEDPDVASSGPPGSAVPGSGERGGLQPAEELHSRGKILLTGTDNNKEGTRLPHLASAQGHTRVQLDLVVRDENGTGVEQDMKVIDLNRKASAQGHPEAPEEEETAAMASVAAQPPRKPVGGRTKRKATSSPKAALQPPTKKPKKKRRISSDEDTDLDGDDDAEMMDGCEEPLYQRGDATFVKYCQRQSKLKGYKSGGPWFQVKQHESRHIESENNYEVDGDFLSKTELVSAWGVCPDELKAIKAVNSGCFEPVSAPDRQEQKMKDVEVVNCLPFPCAPGDIRRWRVEYATATGDVELKTRGELEAMLSGPDLDAYLASQEALAQELKAEDPASFEPRMSSKTHRFGRGSRAKTGGSTGTAVSASELAASRKAFESIPGVVCLDVGDAVPFRGERFCLVASVLNAAPCQVSRYVRRFLLSLADEQGFGAFGPIVSSTNDCKLCPSALALGKIKGVQKHAMIPFLLSTAPAGRYIVRASSNSFVASQHFIAVHVRSPGDGVIIDPGYAQVLPLTQASFDLLGYKTTDGGRRFVNA